MFSSVYNIFLISLSYIVYNIKNILCLINIFLYSFNALKAFI